MQSKINYCNRINKRIAAGVIRQNSPAQAPFLIRDCCNATKLIPALQEKMRKESNKIVERRAIARADEKRKKKNIMRLIARNKYQDDPNGD